MSTEHATSRNAHTTGEVASLDQAVAVFVGVRPRLQSIAYRIIGCWAEAEDVVQDAWVRWQTCERDNVRDATAFLVTMTTRLALNSATSARARRESYIGHWSTEPVDANHDPGAHPEQNEALELGVLLMFERLSPTERAAYVLRRAFDYPYETIADMLDLSGANARQIVSRAGNHLASDRCRPVNTADQGRLVKAFVAAAARGEMSELEHVLAA